MIYHICWVTVVYKNVNCQYYILKIGLLFAQHRMWQTLLQRKASWSTSLSQILMYLWLVKMFLHNWSNLTAHLLSLTLSVSPGLHPLIPTSASLSLAHSPLLLMIPLRVFYVWSAIIDRHNQEAFLSSFILFVCAVSGLCFCPGHHPPRQQVACCSHLRQKEFHWKMTARNPLWCWSLEGKEGRKIGGRGKARENEDDTYEMNTIDQYLNRDEFTQHWAN